MKLTGNTILITGGGSGIGRGLAENFHRLGNQVIIAGRRAELLEKVARANSGMEYVVLDVEDPESIARVSSELTAKYPALNVLVNNAGIMRAENLLDPQKGLADSEAIVRTNLLGPIRLIAALLPHLRRQPHAAVMNVSSGLAFVPLVFTPTYCATKAAIHSYTESLRFQLEGSSVDVLELIPPYVQTELMDGNEDPRAMPLKDFIAEVFQILETKPDAVEICVERVGGLRGAAASGHYDKVFRGLNEAMASRKPE